MEFILVLAFLFVATLNWKSVVDGPKWLEYLTKPMAMVILAGLAAASGQESFWLFAAIGLSLAGDVFLMLPPKYFTSGLAAFLLAHLSYVAAIDAPLEHRLIGTFLALGATLGATIPVLRAVPSRFMRAAVSAYILAICLMAGSAFGSESLLALAGAALFVVSDSMLALDHFVKPVRLARPMVMVTYHLGQLVLVLALLR